MIEHLQFFSTSIIASALIALVCGFVGVFLVMKRLSFIADTFAHGALLGVALGYVLHISQSVTLIPFGVALAILMTWFSRNRSENLSSLTAVVFSVSVGAGILILSKLGRPGQELVHILFGDILSIYQNDLILVILIGLPVVFLFGYFRKSILLSYLNTDLARLENVNLKLVDYGTLIGYALIVMVCLKLVGVMLVTALLTIPALISLRLAKNFNQTLILSPILSLIFSMLGMAASMIWDFPSGACIATLLGVFFMFITAMKKTT